MSATKHRIASCLLVVAAAIASEGQTNAQRAARPGARKCTA